MTEYVKMGKEDFEIKDWVTLKEHANKFVMEFRCNGNVKAARAMVNAKLAGLNGKYCVRDGGTNQEIVERTQEQKEENSRIPNKENPVPIHSSGLASEMEARTKKEPTAAMPGSTRGL